MHDTHVALFLANANVSFRNPYLDAMKEIVCGLHPDCASEFQKFVNVQPDSSSSSNTVLNRFIISEDNARQGFTRPWTFGWKAVTIGVVDDERQTFDPATDDKMAWYASRGLTRDRVLAYVDEAISLFAASMEVLADPDARVALVWLGLKEPIPPVEAGIDEREAAKSDDVKREESEAPEGTGVESDDDSSGSGSSSSSSDSEGS